MDKNEHELHSGRIRRARREGATNPSEVSPHRQLPQMPTQAPKQSLSDAAFQPPSAKKTANKPTVPPQNIPAQGIPRMPQQSMPQQRMPQQSMPQQRMPQQSMPQQRMPQQNMPQQRMPQQNMPRQSMLFEEPSLQAPRQRMPQQNVPQQSVPRMPAQAARGQIPRQEAPRQRARKLDEEMLIFSSKDTENGHPNSAFETQAVPRQKNGKKRKRSKAKILISLCLVFLLIFGGGTAFALGYLDSLLNTDLLGSITNYIPKEYSKSDVVNVLIVGIDNEEGRDYGAGLGMTDMILYASFDIQNNKLNLLQIPRDSYIGDEVPTGGTGKINAALISGTDTENPINNLVKVVEEQFLLPVDHYIALDMDGLTSIVDAFGGLRVYVPQEMSFEGSYLPQGWQWLDGNGVEFFVRNRSGPGFEQADLSRLDNQRYFYSALFRRFLNLQPVDIVNLMPVFEHYCSTDIGLTDIFDLAYTALNLSSEGVMFCKVPGATGVALDPSGQGRDLYIVDIYGRGTPEDPGVANLLNQYFRTYTDPVSGEALGLPQIGIPSDAVLYSPNIQVMSSVQAEEGGAEVNVEPPA